jgi:hypothetical protein
MFKIKFMLEGQYAEVSINRRKKVGNNGPLFSLNARNPAG